jgi:hypothetical protein
MFAKRGGRLSSSGPSPSCGWSSSEVEQAGEAIASAEEEADRQLQPEECQQPPGAGGDAEQRDRTDDSLVCAWCTRVDHVCVPVGVGGTFGALHKVRY